MLRLIFNRLRGTTQFFGKVQIREKCSISGNIVPSNGSGGFDLTFLGTSSQGGARRYPSCLALRVRGLLSSQVWLFDAGEGATAQLQRSNMRVGLVRKIFITHLHGDHLFGLPGLIMATLGRRDEFGPASRISKTSASSSSPVSNLSPSILNPSSPISSSSSPYISLSSAQNVQSSLQQSGPSVCETLHVYGPQGTRSFLRTALGVASFRLPSENALCIHELVWPFGSGSYAQRARHRQARPYWRRVVRALPFEKPGRDIEAERSSEGQWTYRLISEPEERNQEISYEADDFTGSVIAAPVLHTVPTYAYTVTETVASRRFNKDKLGQLGIPKDGRGEVRELFSKWLNGDRGTWQGKEIDVDDVMEDGRRARRLCVVGDTYDATPAAHIAKGVDVLVHEATNLTAQSNLAHSRGHSSPIGATNFAKLVGAKRLIINHTSVAYNDRKLNALENEAREAHGSKNVFVARDLSVFCVPTEEEDGEDFLFRRFLGFSSSIEFKPSQMNPFKGDFSVHEDENSDVDGEDEELSDDAGQQFEDISSGHEEDIDSAQMEGSAFRSQARLEAQELDGSNPITW